MENSRKYKAFYFRHGLIDFEKFKNYLDSEEGQQAMGRMAEKWTKEDDFNKRWKKRVKYGT